MTAMTNRGILETAMRQSAIDLNCRAEDFSAPENRVVVSRAHPQARKYLALPFDCNLVSYGTAIVASVRPDLQETVSAYISRFPMEHCFETPALHVLDAALQPSGLQTCFMAEYFLPDLNRLEEHPCGCEVRIMGPEDFQTLYLPQWSNALCEKRKHLDVLGAGAFRNGQLIGLAGASADCDSMYQIGIDVLPEHRRKGIGSALTSRLALEILKRGKVPFYCAAWSNIRSVRNAIDSGFRPAWVELTVKPAGFAVSL